MSKFCSLEGKKVHFQAIHATPNRSKSAPVDWGGVREETANHEELERLEFGCFTNWSREGP